jgi:hypothetical protein
MLVGDMAFLSAIAFISPSSDRMVSWMLRYLNTIPPRAVRLEADGRAERGHCAAPQAETSRAVQGAVDLHLRRRGLQRGAHTESAEVVCAGRMKRIP